MTLSKFIASYNVLILHYRNLVHVLSDDELDIEYVEYLYGKIDHAFKDLEKYQKFRTSAQRACLQNKALTDF